VAAFAEFAAIRQYPIYSKGYEKIGEKFPIPIFTNFTVSRGKHHQEAIILY